MFRKESQLSIKALDKELERLHDLLKIGNKEANGIIFDRVVRLQDLLCDVTRRYNGMEY